MTQKNKSGGGKRPYEWTPEKIQRLKELYPHNHNDAVAAKLHTTVRAIRNAAMRFRVKKAARYWYLYDEYYVVKNWPTMSAVEIGRKIGRTRWAVINKYRELVNLR
jgi:hypothetical protein